MPRCCIVASCMASASSTRIDPPIAATWRPCSDSKVHSCARDIARIDDALVRAQILRRPRRRTAVQIGRRRNQMALHRAEPAGNQRARLQVSDPQREFDAFFHQIDEALAETDVDPHFRIIPDIVGDDRNHVAPSERRRHADPERAGRAGRRLLDARPRHIEGADDLTREIVDAVRLGRRFELARRAQETAACRIRSSSSAMRLLIAGWPMPSSFAAAEKLPPSRVRTKARRQSIRSMIHSVSGINHILSIP